MNTVVSRRNFLRSATGTVSLSCGGIRILAGPTTAQSAEKESQIPRLTQPFVYGSAFFRPPNPPISMRREMLKAIAQEYKFNIIRIYCSWVYLNPEQGRFDFSEVEEIMRQCDELGLKMLMGAVI